MIFSKRLVLVWRMSGTKVSSTDVKLFIDIVFRSYHDETTASHQNCEVKHRWAGLVLLLGTKWESPVLKGITFCFTFVLQNSRAPFYKMSPMCVHSTRVVFMPSKHKIRVRVPMNADLFSTDGSQRSFLNYWKKFCKKVGWSIWVSIPVPRACEARALPIAPIPRL